MSSAKFAILGATGKVGGRAARSLLADGHQIRAVVRDLNSKNAQDLRSKGAELFEVRAAEGATDPYATNETQLVAALTGVEAAFIINPSHLHIADPNKSSATYINALARAVVASKIQRVVLLSSWTAWIDSGVGAKLLYLEKVFNRIAKEHKVAITYLRPGFFYTNIVGALSALPHGIFPAAISDANTKVPFTSTDDIGDQAAKELLCTEKQPSNPKIVQIAGPEDLSFAEVTKIISEITGKDIKYAPIAAEKRHETFLSWGLSTEGSRQFAELFAGIEDQTAAYQFNEPIIRGKHTFKDFLAAQLKN